MSAELNFPEPEGYFTTTDDGRWVEAPEGADRSRLTPLYGQSALQAKEAELVRMRDLADSEGSRAVKYLRRARKAEAEIAALKATADEDAHVIERLGTLLACVSIALKGDELPLHRHSYHDLADVADAIKLELDLYRAAFPNGIPADVLDSARAAGDGEGMR